MGKAQWEGKEQEAGELDSQHRDRSTVCQEHPKWDSGSPSFGSTVSPSFAFFAHKASLPGVKSWSTSLHTHGKRDFLQGCCGITGGSVVIIRPVLLGPFPAGTVSLGACACPLAVVAPQCPITGHVMLQMPGEGSSAQKGHHPGHPGWEGHCQGRAKPGSGLGTGRISAGNGD